MKNFSSYVGIDIAKQTVQAAFYAGSTLITKSFANTIPGLAALLQWLQSHEQDPQTTLFCCEHTGLYTRPLQVFCVQKNLFLWVEHPQQISLSKGLSRGKSDPADAAMIARYARLHADKAQPCQAHDVSLAQLGMLIAERRRLVRAKRMLTVPLGEYQRIDPALAKHMSDRQNTVIEELKQAIKRTETAITTFIAHDAELARLDALARSVPGVGKMVSAILLYVTKGFRRLTDPKKLACFAGVAPFPHSSGSSIRGRNRVSPQADKRIKTMLHQAVLTLLRTAQHRQWYDQRKTAGKHPLNILNTMKNNMIHLICAVIRRGTPYMAPAQWSAEQEKQRNLYLAQKAATQLIQA